MTLQSLTSEAIAPEIPEIDYVRHLCFMRRISRQN